MGEGNGAAAVVAASEQLRASPKVVFGERSFVPWNAADDRAILDGLLAGKRLSQIAEAMPYRTVASIGARATRLREMAGESTAQREMNPVEANTAHQTGCTNLLAALLRYGANKPNPKGLPGLGHTRFRELCRQHRIAIPETTVPTKEPAHG